MQGDEKVFMLNNIWNNPQLEKVAVKLSHLTSIVYLLFGMLLIVLGLNGIGVGWTVIGIIIVIAAALYLRFNHLRQCPPTHIICPRCTKEWESGVNFCPDCGTAVMFQEVVPSKDVRVKKKVNLLVCCGVIVLAAVLLVSNQDTLRGGPIFQIKNVTFDDYGPQTVEELVQANFKSAKWSSERLDSSSSLVYVDGYMPNLGENVRLEFYYEDYGNGTFRYSLNSVRLLRSGETYSGTWDIALFLAMLY